jgi:thiamine biosynthesis lipoprotein
LPETRDLMGMPITIEVTGDDTAALVEHAFRYFEAVDRRFSTYRADSEISALNTGAIQATSLSDEMREVFAIADLTRRQTDGYFDIKRADGSIDPSGIVKGWAIRNVARLIAGAGFGSFFVEAGGDVQSAGRNRAGSEWRVGIRNPFHPAEIIKVIEPRGRGVATSGTYARGQHIYNPHVPDEVISSIVSLSVIGPDILEADRFATAAFAMGVDGIGFIEAMPGLEGYLVDSHGTATMTTAFESLVCA